MAPPIVAKSNQRGNALVESLPVMFLLVSLVVGLLLAAYLLFARAWIAYQSEQALYCSLQMQSASGCQIQLESQLRDFLPYGEIQTRVTGINNNWLVEVQWHYREYQMLTRRRLDPELIQANRVLRY
jgi:hypothetical protein